MSRKKKDVVRPFLVIFFILEEKNKSKFYGVQKKRIGGGRPAETREDRRGTYRGFLVSS